VLLERRAVAVPVLVDVHPLVPDGVADRLALGLDVTVHYDLAGDHGFLRGECLLAANRHPDRPLLEGVCHVAGRHRSVCHVHPVDGHFLVAELDRHVDLLGVYGLADIDFAHLALPLLDIKALFDDGDSNIALGAELVGRPEVLLPLGTDVEPILFHALERADGDAPLANVGELVVVAVDGAVVPIVGPENMQPLAQLALQIHQVILRIELSACDRPTGRQSDRGT